MAFIDISKPYNEILREKPVCPECRGVLLFDPFKSEYFCEKCSRIWGKMKVLMRNCNKKPSIEEYLCAVMTTSLADLNRHKLKITREKEKKKENG